MNIVRLVEKPKYAAAILWAEAQDVPVAWLMSNEVTTVKPPGITRDDFPAGTLWIQTDGDGYAACTPGTYLVRTADGRLHACSEGALRVEYDIIPEPPKEARRDG